MTGPPQATPQPDDPTIIADDILWRYIDPVYGVTTDKQSGQRRLSSGGFSDSSDGSGMSAHLVQPGEHLDTFVRTQRWDDGGVAELRVGQIRDLGKGYGVIRKPFDGDENHPPDPNHVEITGGAGRKQLQRKQEALKSIATVLRMPPMLAAPAPPIAPAPAPSPPAG